MSKYLVVDFNRYDTHLSTHTVYEADSHDDVLKQYTEGSVDGFNYYKELHVVRSEAFSCVPLEEADVLIYNLDLIG